MNNLNGDCGLWRCWLVPTLFALSLCTQAQENEIGDFSSREAITQRLESLRLEMADADSHADIFVQNLLQKLNDATYQHLEAVDDLAESLNTAKLAEDALSSWQGFDVQPPYSIQFLDDLRAPYQSLQLETRSTESRIRIIKQAIEDASGRLARHQQNLRQLTERAENTITVKEEQDNLLAIQNEDLSSRIQAEVLARLQLRWESQLARKTAGTAKFKLAKLKFEAALGKVQFTRDELQEIQVRIEKERSQLRKAAWDAETEQPEVDWQFTWKTEILNIEQEFWNQLYAALNEQDESSRAAAVTSLSKLKGRIDDWVEIIRLQTSDYLGEGSHAVGELLTAADLQRVIRLQNQLKFTIGVLMAEGVEGQDLFNMLAKDALAIWETELYLAEETDSIGGKKITTFRAVTLGKLFRLIFILVAGWFLLRLLSRVVSRLVAKRSTVTQDVADAAGSWTFGLGLAFLLIFALNRVHIPFSAFAFLGGTLAIGIGFGAQTLLKNIISGIMLRFERPFKVGDLVEVDDFSGRIKHIGLRASLIRHFDGVDTLVPNSSLLENRVSNWTLGDTALRAEITIGVAYGSQSRDVTRALLAVAEKHGLVLEHPEPEVRLEDFGDNSLKFRLLCWFDAARIQRDALASDLRFMIDRAFSDAGIVIAFPQRDIHFDDSKPLRVELSKGEAGTR